MQGLFLEKRFTVARGQWLAKEANPRAAVKQKEIMEPYYNQSGLEIYHGDVLAVLRTLPAGYVQTVVTSPPYWGLRNYGIDGQVGLETTPEEYTKKMTEIFREVRRVLKDDGTCWVNLGDTYSAQRWTDNSAQKINKYKDKHRGIAPEKKTNLPDKNLVGIPWRVAFALQADGWYLRQDIIWHKPNPMPESVTDRCTKAHEYIFLLSKSAKYFYDAEAIKEKSKYSDDDRRARASAEQKRTPTDKVAGIREGSAVYPNRNKRSVWEINPKPYKDAHFATFPKKIPTFCISAGSKTGDVVMDIFHGSGTSGEVAQNLNRKYIGVELKEDYIKMSLKRYKQGVLSL